MATITPTLTTPTADFSFSYGRQTIDGAPVTVVDMDLDPSGDVALVTGAERLVQDIVRWLMCPQGSYPFDPTYGNPLWAQVGRPATATTNDYLAMITHAEAAFLLGQARDAAAGYLSLDEQIATIKDQKVTRPTPNTVTVSFTVVTKAGTALPVILPFS